MHQSKIENSAKQQKQRHQDWKVIKNLLPYIKAYKARIIFTLFCLVLAKVANLGVPIMLKNIVDAMSITSTPKALLVVPVSLIVAYGLLRLSASKFAELRELIFSKVTDQAVRQVGLQVFNHLHALSLRFHLSRQTGGMTRDIERGTRGIQSLISYSLWGEILLIITTQNSHTKKHFQKWKNQTAKIRPHPAHLTSQTILIRKQNSLCSKQYSNSHRTQ